MKFPELNGDAGLRVTAINVHPGREAIYDNVALSMPMVQVAVGYAFGLLLALGLVELASRWIEHDFGRLIASQAFADKITITDLSLLPLHLDNVLYIGGWGFGIVLAITVGLLWRLLLLRRIEPSRLLIHD
jgi:hypothetical protein